MDFDDHTIDSQEPSLQEDDDHYSNNYHSNRNNYHTHRDSSNGDDCEYERLQQDAVEQLALEAINKIKTELLGAPSPSSPSFSLNFAVVEERVYARLERLGQLIDWPLRYKDVLDKLKTFLLTHPRCREEFEVKQDAYNPIVHYVRSRHGGEMVEVPLPSGMHRYASEELSVSSNLANELPAAQENADSLKEQALAKIREILLSQGTHYHMKLTLLNTQSRWPSTYGRTFGSLKQWIRYLNDIGEVQDIAIIDNLGPGNDYVELLIGSYRRSTNNNNNNNSSGRENTVPAARRGPPAQAPPQNVLYAAPQPAAATTNREDSNMNIPRRTPYFPPLLVESQSGVRVSDYFFLPLPTDLIEISYHRSMENNTALLRRWTDLRIIHDCWSYDSDQFKKYEWFGDTVLRAELSKTLLLNYSSLFDISGLDARRQNAEQRLTMSLLFDELKLAQFVQQCPPSWVASKWKAKCDFIEALLGELVMKMHDAGERGIPFGHPERESIQRFVRSVCEAALDRGAKMKSPLMRTEIDNDAQRPGSGGYLMEELDRQAMNRQSQQV